MMGNPLNQLQIHLLFFNHREDRDAQARLKLAHVNQIASGSCDVATTMRDRASFKTKILTSTSEY